MIQKVNYIYCPECGGIIENTKNDEFDTSLHFYEIHQMPRCKECGTPYKIIICSNGIMKIILEKAH